MSPMIVAGNYLLFHHFTFSCFLKEGSIVKVQHPLYGLIVKKIERIDKDGFYWLVGAGEHSVTSKQMGKISNEMIKGICFKLVR